MVREWLTVEELPSEHIVHRGMGNKNERYIFGTSLYDRFPFSSEHYIPVVVVTVVSKKMKQAKRAKGAYKYMLQREQPWLFRNPDVFVYVEENYIHKLKEVMR